MQWRLTTVGEMKSHSSLSDVATPFSPSAGPLPSLLFNPNNQHESEDSQMMKPEKWKPIVGFEGFYEVSDRGRVRSLDRICLHGRWGGTRLWKGKMLALTPGKQTGYVNVCLSGGGKTRSTSAHVLVAEAFIPNPSALPVVNHKTPGKKAKSDNRVGNLEWSTTSDNQLLSYKHGTSLPTRGELQGGSKLTVGQVTKIRSLYAAKTYTQYELAEMFGVNQATISEIIHGKNWKHIATKAAPDQRMVITASDAHKIRSMYKGRGRGPTQDAIGSLFGITGRNVGCITRGETWQQVPPKHQPSTVHIGQKDSHELKIVA
jgi:DNA-binding XRE family transcriptional regulator